MVVKNYARLEQAKALLNNIGGSMKDGYATSFNVKSLQEAMLALIKHIEDQE